MHMAFCAFFKVGQKCDGITEDHGLEASSESITEKMQVGRCRRSSCRKWQSGDFVITEMAHLFHTTGHERCTVTSQRYASLLKRSVNLDLKVRRCDKTTVLKQDGAPKHMNCFVKQLLHRHFDDEKIISLQFPTAWHLKSPDLNICNFWL